MKKILLIMISTILLLGSGFAYENGNSSSARYYDDAKVVKVKYSRGDTYVNRSYDKGSEEAGVNIPIFEKDIAGTNNGRLDIYLGRSNFLRLDNDTEVEFHKLPKLRKTDMSIFIKRGGIYLDLFSMDYEKDIEIQTPDCGVFILSKGVYRINFYGERGTEIFIYDGAAEVAGDNYSKIIRENQKITMRNGSVFERPYYFSSSEKDDFDSWNEERHGVANYARSGSSRYLQRGYEDTEYELTRRGRWRYNSSYSTYIWIPYNVGYDWRPYYNGRWVYTPYYGYVWYSYDTWGSYTYHYGRWQYNSFWGWYWIPGYRWSPAWVSWGYSGNYYGWTPLSYYNRPVIVINKRWLKNYNYRNGIPIRSMSTVVVRKGNLSSSIRKVAIKRNTNGRINIKHSSLSYIGASPSIRPKYNTVKVINSKGRATLYKKGAIISSKNFNTGRTLGSGNNSATVYKYKGSTSSSAKAYKYSSGSKLKYNNYGSSHVKKYNTKRYPPSKYRSYNRGAVKSSSSGYRTGSYKGKTKYYKTKGAASSSQVKKSTSSSSTKKIKKKKKYPYFSSNGYSSYRNYSSANSSSARRYTSGRSYSKPLTKKKYSSGWSKKYSYGSSYRNSAYKSKTYKSYSSPSRKYSNSYGSYKYSSPYKNRSTYSGYKSSRAYTYTPKKSYSYKKPLNYKSSYSKSYTPKRSSSYSGSSRRSSSYRVSSSRSSSSRSSSSYRSSTRSSSTSSKSYKKK